jgi:putative Mg2+ transporter-C (MgtC) family protein
MSNSDLTVRYHIWRIPTFLFLFISTTVFGIISIIELPAVNLMAAYTLNINDYVQNIFTILLATTVGCLIGWEREIRNRPAGLRTYSLVCIGAAIVMITSFEIFKTYNLLNNFDPTRLGAQVISGIGFLGAGTIIRDRFSVKGLTTAASLWTVACIGLMIGARMYFLSIIVTFVIYYVLHNLHSIDEIKGEKAGYNITVTIKNLTNQFEEIRQLLKGYSNRLVEMNSVSDKILNDTKETELNFKLTLYENDDESQINELVIKLYQIQDIQSVKVER